MGGMGMNGVAQESDSGIRLRALLKLPYKEVSVATLEWLVSLISSDAGHRSLI
jgi:hypothetical protein